MAKKTQEELRAAVIAEITAANGEITHTELADKLNASGNGAAVAELRPMKLQKLLKAETRVEGEEKPQLYYSLGG